MNNNIYNNLINFIRKRAFELMGLWEAQARKFDDSYLYIYIYIYISILYIDYILYID